MFFFIHHVAAIVFAHFHIGCELDRVGRAGLLAHATHNAARKVDAKKFRVPASVFLHPLLQGNAVYRTGYCTEVAGDAALLAIGVPGQHNTAAITRREVGHLFRILHGFRFGKAVLQDGPNGTQLAHECAEHGVYPSSASAMAPVSNRLKSVRGSMTFQPRDIS